jgi:Tfp pilus assembly protein PilF
MHKRTAVVISTAIAILILIAAQLGCAKSRLVLGDRLEATGRYSDALSAYESALQRTSPSDRQMTSQVYYRIGDCLVRLQRMPEAFHAYQAAADADPGNAAAHVRMGEFMESAGLGEAARREAEMALRVQPRNSEAIALLGGALEKIGDKNGAKREYEKSLAIDAGRPSVAIALADLYNQDDQTAKAEQVLETSAKTNPHRAAPLLALGRLHEQEGEIGEAELAYRAAVRAEDTKDSNLRLAQFLQRTSRIAEAEQILRRVDSRDPADPTALADFELIAGHPLSALQAYEETLLRQKQAASAKAPGEQERARVATRIVEADLELSNDADGQTVAAAVQRGREHLMQYGAALDPATTNILEAELALAENDLPTASAKAQSALDLAPHSASALYTQGLVRLRCSDPAGAHDFWTKALEEDPSFVPAQLALGEEALGGGDAADAEHDVLPVVREEPANMRALRLFARVLTAKGMYPAATTIARRMEALAPRSPEPYVLMGNIALLANRQGEALVDFEHAVVLDPHSAEGVEGLTKVYRTGKITRPTLLRIERVAGTKPESGVLMEIAGRLFADNHWYTDAERCLEEALRIDPHRATAAAALADTLVKTGDLPAAADSAAKTGGNAAALLAGVKAQEQNDTRSAIENYERAVRGGETTGVAANNLAWLYAEQGQNLGRALALAQAAESLSPGDPAVLDTMGVVRLRRREYSEAIKTLEAARDLSKRMQPPARVTAQIREHLAEAYWKAGNTAAAKSVGIAPAVAATPRTAAGKSH